MGKAEEIAEGLTIICAYIQNPDIYNTECERLTSATHLVVDGCFPAVMEEKDVAKLKELNWRWDIQTADWNHELST